MKPHDRHHTDHDQNSQDRIRLRLQDTQSDVCHDQRVSNVDQHVQPLPDWCSQTGQPEIVAGGRHQEQNQERQKAQWLKRKPVQAVIPRVADEEADQRVQDAESMKLEEREPPVSQRNEKHRDAEMTAIVKQRQEGTVQPAKRTHDQDHMQHEQGAGPQPSDEQCLYRGVRMDESSETDKDAEIDEYEGEHQQVVVSFLPVPSDGPIAVAHSFPLTSGINACGSSD